jgi:transcriptional regulator with XRE-family HTH domain
MTSSTRIPVRPQVLRWARETAGLDVPTAAHRLGVKPERIAAWETGEAVPTIRQVRTMAASYHRPLAALFMADPIANEKLARLPDFRRSEHHAEIMPSALQRAIMRAYRQRDALVGIAEDLDSHRKKSTPGSNLIRRRMPRYRPTT